MPDKMLSTENDSGFCTNADTALIKQIRIANELDFFLNRFDCISEVYLYIETHTQAHPPEIRIESNRMGRFKCNTDENPYEIAKITFHSESAN